jgi:small-conductance mechanosensitive channel
MTAAFAQTAPTSASEAMHTFSAGGAVDVLRLKVDSWIAGFFYLLPNLITALVIGLVFIGIAFAFSHLVRRLFIRGARHDLGHVLGAFAFWATTFLGFLVVITIVLPSMQPVDIFTSLGIGSVAAGFAFKDVLQNWVAGLLILIRRPFHRGDQIRVGDTEGTVQAVETRATLVKTYNGRLVIIPNSDIYTRSVTVHTAYDVRRTEIVVPVGLDVDLDDAIEVFRSAVLSAEDVLEEPPPDILPWEFRENNVDIRVRWWIKSQRSYEVRSRAAVVRAIKLASEDAGIALPADTKISFAETPLIVAQATSETEKEKKHRRPAAKRPEHKSAAPAAAPDEASDPEAEKPKLGELSEGADAVPR